MEYAPALYSRFPELAGRLPWLSLRGTSTPSLPQRLVRSQHLFGENYVYMKREALDFHTLPDNKARKLEFVLGDALQRRQRKLVTFGYVGSSHCLATVKAARENQLKAEVVLLRCPLTRDAIDMVDAMKGLGAKVRLRDTRRGVYLTAAWHWFLSKFLPIQLVPPGGSNGLGTLGYVSAMVELKNQIEDGEMIEPDYLFVAAGSGSTMVGMEIGKRLVGLDRLQIIGVQTSDDEGVDLKRLTEMANTGVEILNRSLQRKIPYQFNGSEFTILKDYLCGGHGEMPLSLQNFIAQFQELESIELDSVYTSKAFWGMCEFIKKNKLSQKKFLFWNTTSPFRRGDVRERFSYSKIRGKLRRWIRADQSQGRLADLGRL